MVSGEHGEHGQCVPYNSKQEADNATTHHLPMEDKNVQPHRLEPHKIDHAQSPPMGTGEAGETGHLVHQDNRQGVGSVTAQPQLMVDSFVQQLQLEPLKVEHALQVSSLLHTHSCGTYCTLFLHDKSDANRSDVITFCVVTMATMQKNMQIFHMSGYLREYSSFREWSLLMCTWGCTIIRATL